MHGLSPAATVSRAGAARETDELLTGRGEIQLERRQAGAPRERVPQPRATIRLPGLPLICTSAPQRFWRRANKPPRRRRSVRDGAAALPADVFDRALHLLALHGFEAVQTE